MDDVRLQLEDAAITCTLPGPSGSSSTDPYLFVSIWYVQLALVRIYGHSCLTCVAWRIPKRTSPKQEKEGAERQGVCVHVVFAVRPVWTLVVFVQKNGMKQVCGRNVLSIAY